ncbi:nitrilase-related carbon-nitrogen hydrolase [Roseomonas mucosa]|uniref:nitrilase-related carbon-nitrogen hydrolase n=1 Tax=Roseomonas mucosa TaxID=207340 RepID=UPI00384BE284
MTEGVPDSPVEGQAVGSSGPGATVRVAACTTPVRLADPAANAETILEVAHTCAERSVSLVAFPELALTGYSIDDLFLQDVVLEAAEAALERIVEASARLPSAMVLGVPLRHAGRLYNTAVIVHRGRLLGVVPKVHLPNYREFYERRYFASGDGTDGSIIRVGRHSAPFGPDLLFVAEERPRLIIHVEICEDMWVPKQPSALGALAGATVLVNLSASNITVGKADTRRMLCQAQSARCTAAYLYTASGEGESTTDLAWDGQTSIYEDGVLLAETSRFEPGARLAVADVDVNRLNDARARSDIFAQCRAGYQAQVARFRRVPLRFGIDTDLRGADDRLVGKVPVPACGASEHHGPGS